MSRTKKDLNLPRAPLPKQTGGAHKRKNKVLDRKAKHKMDPRDDKDCRNDDDWDGGTYFDNFVDGRGF